LDDVVLDFIHNGRLDIVEAQEAHGRIIASTEGEDEIPKTIQLDNVSLAFVELEVKELP
jgi:hypothetical protein